jgi:serine/threonine protein kinase
MEGSTRNSVKKIIHMPTEEDPYDLLSFLSLFVTNTTEMTESIYTSMLFLDRMSANLENPVGRGSLFSVIIANTDLFNEYLKIGQDGRIFDGRKEVALKRPLVRGKPTSRRNRQILSAMAVEFQVFRTEALQNEKNIVQLLGVCWQTADINEGLILPVFVLEAAEYGNLAEFMQSGEEISHEERFWLLLDAAAGLFELHENSITHCDVKPENILVFKGQDRKFKAKISDFGSSVFIANIATSFRISNGTQLWQAPECIEPIEPESIHKVDVFSFGCVAFDFISGIRIMESMRREASILPESLKEKDLLGQFAYLGLTGRANTFSGEDSTPASSHQSESEEVDTKIRGSGDETTSRGHALRTAYSRAASLCLISLSKLPAKRLSMEQVIQDLRYILNGLLYANLLRDIPNLSASLIKQWSLEEEDILFCPSE